MRDWSVSSFTRPSGVFRLLRRKTHDVKAVASDVCNNLTFLFFADIQECYEVTLQLNKEQTAVKEDSRQDVREVIFLLHFIEHMFTLHLVSCAAVCCV